MSQLSWRSAHGGPEGPPFHRFAAVAGIPGLLLFLLLAGAAPLAARDEWFRGLDLEPALDQAALVVVARVKDVSETKLIMGGKMESSLVEFKFTPELVLKGVYSRDTLSLTSVDLGGMRYGDLTAIRKGQLRLLILDRSPQGYALEASAPSLAQAIPLIQEASEGVEAGELHGSAQDDPLIESVKALLAVGTNPDRAGRVALLVAALRTEPTRPTDRTDLRREPPIDGRAPSPPAPLPQGERGVMAPNGPTRATREAPGTIPLMVALGRRALLAAQTPGAVAALAPHLTDASPAVREQAAATLHALLDADYLNQPQLRREAVQALAASLSRAGASFAPRVAALEALGAAGPSVLENPAARALFQLADL